MTLLGPAGFISVSHASSSLAHINDKSCWLELLLIVGITLLVVVLIISLFRYRPPRPKTYIEEVKK